MVAVFGLAGAAFGSPGCTPPRPHPVIDLGQPRAPGRTTELFWSPDSQTLYFNRQEDSKVLALNVNGGAASTLGDSFMLFAKVSRDASALFYLDDSGQTNETTPHLFKAPLSGARIGQAVPVASDVSMQYIVSANGNQVAFHDFSDHLKFLDIPSGLTTTLANAYPIAFSPGEGSILADSAAPHQTLLVNLATDARVPVPFNIPPALVTRWDGDTPRAIIDPNGVTDLVTAERHDLTAFSKLVALGGDPSRPTQAFIWSLFCAHEEVVGGGFLGGDRRVECVVQQFQLHRIDLETYVDDVVGEAGEYSTATALSPDGRWLANAVASGQNGRPTIYVKDMNAPSP